MASPWMMHVFDKTDYSKHRLVTLPSQSLPPLSPSSLRLQSKILGLTTNNFSYARLGHVLGWWDVYPLPDNSPVPFNDQSAYARVPVWGYADVIESTVAEIPVGSTVYGFQPSSNLPYDVSIKQTGIKDQIFITSAHRQNVWEIYNRLRVYPSLSEIEKDKGLDYLGYDALMQGLFGTGYNMNTYAFAWKDEHRIHPSGQGEWSAEDANLDDATIVMLNASGKTSMAFAYALRRNRPKEHQPRTLIGVGSSASTATIENSGSYDKTMLNSDAQAAKDLVEKSSTRRVVLIDFGAREGVNAEWIKALSSSSVPFTFIVVGGEVKPQHPDESRNRVKAMGESVLVNANVLREKGISIDGGAYFDKFHKDWDEAKENGIIPGMTLKWEDGMKAFGKAWDALCKDEVPASKGLVFRV